MRRSHAKPGCLLRSAAAALFAFTASGCDDGSRFRTPTAPPDSPPAAPTAAPTPVPPPPSSLWSGSWSLRQASPAGDCLADALNAFAGAGGLDGWLIDLTVERDGDRVRLRFWFAPGNKDSEGFWPLEYAGKSSGDGAVVAQLVPERVGDVRTDPWLDLCYWEWSAQGGQLWAELSADGRRISGTVAESFRVEPGGSWFTIQSEFTATAR